MRNIVVLTSFAAIHSLDNLPIDNREFTVTETLTVLSLFLFLSSSSIHAVNGLNSFLRRQTIGKMDGYSTLSYKKRGKKNVLVFYIQREIFMFKWLVSRQNSSAYSCLTSTHAP